MKVHKLHCLQIRNTPLRVSKNYIGTRFAGDGEEKFSGFPLGLCPMLISYEIVLIIVKLGSVFYICNTLSPARL